MYNVITISAVYAHPIEYLFGNAFPSISSLLILKSKMHIITTGGFIFFRFIESHETHSGIEFPYSIFAFYPFHTGSKYHDFHHLKNIGNYGSFTSIWDTIFGTNIVYLNEKNNSNSNIIEKIKKS